LGTVDKLGKVSVKSKPITTTLHERKEQGHKHRKWGEGVPEDGKNGITHCHFVLSDIWTTSAGKNKP